MKTISSHEFMDMRLEDKFQKQMKEHFSDYPHTWGKFCYDEGYLKGATEQKAIMLEEASRGFEEYIAQYADNGIMLNRQDLHEKTWQAATLSKMKEIEEFLNNVLRFNGDTTKIESLVREFKTQSNKD